jgi:hypothetical protein
MITWDAAGFGLKLLLQETVSSLNLIQFQQIDFDWFIIYLNLTPFITCKEKRERYGISSIFKHFAMVIIIILYKERALNIYNL